MPDWYTSTSRSSPSFAAIESGKRRSVVKVQYKVSINVSYLQDFDASHYLGWCNMFGSSVNSEILAQTRPSNCNPFFGLVLPLCGWYLNWSSWMRTLWTSTHGLQLTVDQKLRITSEKHEGINNCCDALRWTTISQNIYKQSNEVVEHFLLYQFFLSSV